MEKSKLKIFISAGDPSGDIHAARLMQALKELKQDIEFIGIGGGEMLKEGLKSIVPMNEISVVGFWEVAKRFNFFRKLMKKCHDLMLSENISAFIPVDYPGFNVRLASFAKKNNIPVIYYIAPQLWAWGKNRAKKLSDCVDKLLVVFPFEVDFFKKFGIDAEFIGHPLLDDPIFDEKPREDKDNQRRIAILPGSRKQEIRKHIGILQKTAQLISKEIPDIKFGIGASPNVDKDEYSDLINLNPNWEIWNDTRELMKKSTIGIIKTGTSTLEAALCNLPFLMFYNTSAFTYYMGKYLVNLPYISLVNILANKPVVKEFIQKDFSPEILSREAIELWKDGNYRQSMKSEFEKIRAILGEKGASMRAAKRILAEVR